MSMNLNLIVDGEKVDLTQTPTTDTYMILGGRAAVHKYHGREFKWTVYRYIRWLVRQAEECEWPLFDLFNKLKQLEKLEDAKEAHFYRM